MYVLTSMKSILVKIFMTCVVVVQVKTSVNNVYFVHDCKADRLHLFCCYDVGFYWFIIN